MCCGPVRPLLCLLASGASSTCVLSPCRACRRSGTIWADGGFGPGDGKPEKEEHEREGQSLLGLRLTLFLPGGVSAARGRPGEGRRGRMDAVRAAARAERDAAPRRRLPP